MNSGRAAMAAGRWISRMLENPFLPRLLKKAQMQGGAQGPSEAYFRYAAASARASQRRRWAL